MIQWLECRLFSFQLVRTLAKGQLTSSPSEQPPTGHFRGLQDWWGSIVYSWCWFNDQLLQTEKLSSTTFIPTPTLAVIWMCVFLDYFFLVLVLCNTRRFSKWVSQWQDSPSCLFKLTLWTRVKCLSLWLRFKHGVFDENVLHFFLFSFSVLHHCVSHLFSQCSQ